MWLDLWGERVNFRAVMYIRSEPRETGFHTTAYIADGRERTGYFPTESDFNSFELKILTGSENALWFSNPRTILNLSQVMYIQDRMSERDWKNCTLCGSPLEAQCGSYFKEVNFCCPEHGIIEIPDTLNVVLAHLVNGDIVEQRSKSLSEHKDWLRHIDEKVGLVDCV